MDPTYPITITREALRAKKACEQGLAAFDKVAPSGVLVVEDVFAHTGLLAGPLAPFEAWAQGKALLPPVRYAGGHGSTVSGGYGSRVSGGDGSHVSGGDGSTLHLRYWDGARDRTAVAYVGEDDIEPDTFYKYEHPKGWVKTFPDSNT